MPQRQRARLLLHQWHEREPARLAVRQQRPRRDDRARTIPAAGHPLAGVHYQQRAERLAYLAGGRHVRCADPVGSRLPRRPAQPRDAAEQLRPGDRAASTSARSSPRSCSRRSSGASRSWTGGSRACSSRTRPSTGPESRGSSPVRIPRDQRTRQSPAVAGLYPCGEGAGYAGGIISAAVDGLRTARVLVATFARPDA